jgi:hypothetical protein
VVLITPPPDHDPARAVKGEAGAASVAPPDNDSDASSSVVLMKPDPDILMASISV